MVQSDIQITSWRCDTDRILEFEVSGATVEPAAQAVGGVCPFAVKEGVKVFPDVSMKRFETVYPACGSSNSAIEMTIEELEKYFGFLSVGRRLQGLG